MGDNDRGRLLERAADRPAVQRIVEAIERPGGTFNREALTLALASREQMIAELAAALARVEQERDEARAALKDEMKWDAGGVPENEWKRRAEAAEQERDEAREAKEKQIALGDALRLANANLRDERGAAEARVRDLVAALRWIAFETTERAIQNKAEAVLAAVPAPEEDKP